MKFRWFPGLTLLVSTCAWPTSVPAADETNFLDRLHPLPYKIAYETYVDDNWEIFVMDADGSHPTNLTRTPKVQEHYPQVSPDGSKICFVADEGEGRDTVRTLYVMDSNGARRRKIADHAREPFWTPDGRSIGYLGQEYARFNVIDYYTRGMYFHDLATGQIREHPLGTNLHHLYNPGFAANGKWIVATVHAGMGYNHTILLIEAQGTNIVDLKIHGCRPCFSPDGSQIAWGPGDHEIATAPIDFEAKIPAVGERRVRILDATNKIYHVDWSPDSRFLSISRGPDGGGDLSKAGTFQAACEIMGVYAPGWNLLAVSAERTGSLDLNKSTPADFGILTTNGLSNKESAWFRPPAAQPNR